ncbi:MAG: AAA family ATPase [Planctomycetaceae bacterium]|nr:AAA family ATPase [Planctomycetaceae bacterium]
MPADHFQRLLRSLDLEAEAEMREMVRQMRTGGGTAAERSGQSLVGLAIRDETGGFGGRVVVTLGKRDRRLQLPWSRLNQGTPVILTEENGRSDHGWRGIVTDRDRETITVALNESPEPEADRPLFRLDLSSDETARLRQKSALKRAMTLERGRPALLKRRLMGEEPPEFAAPKPWTPFGSIDESQREAVDFALSAKDLAIIHGPPGTGKTTAIVELIRQSINRGEKVLACAPSNLAVDNLLERLLASGERAIRIGHPARVLPTLREKTLDVIVENHPDYKLAKEWTKEAWNLRKQAGKYTRTPPPPGFRRDLREEAKKLLNEAAKLEARLVDYLLDSATVVCATLTGVNEELLGDRQFDLVVIDEAAQTTEPPCWIPILRSARIVLAGDHCQLPPTVVSAEAARQGFDVSLMERLMTHNPEQISRRLTTQYRMHDEIMSFSSEEFYEGSLRGAPQVASHLLHDLSHVETNPITETAIRFFDTAGSHCTEQTETEGSSRENRGEAEYVSQQVAELLKSGVRPEEIGVITPYGAQARLLREMIAERGVEVDTVDGFQGREKEAVLISLVRSNTSGELGFLTDTRRMNVALTRARRKLIVFGDSSTLAHLDFYNRLLEYFEIHEAYGTIWELGTSEL